MVDLNPYGRKGCSCWSEVEVGSHNGVAEERWYPNAGCRFHGLLAGYEPERQDTGVYSVVPVGYKPPSEPEPGPECPPGVHSMFDFCPGGCTEHVTEEQAAEALAFLEAEDECEYAGMYGGHGHIFGNGSRFCVVDEVTTTHKETGVHATVQRWGRRLWDALLAGWR